MVNRPSAERTAPHDRILQQEKRRVLLRQLEEATRITTYLHSQLRRCCTGSGFGVSFLVFTRLQSCLKAMFFACCFSAVCLPVL